MASPQFSYLKKQTAFFQAILRDFRFGVSFGVSIPLALYSSATSVAETLFLPISQQKLKALHAQELRLDDMILPPNEFSFSSNKGAVIRFGSIFGRPWKNGVLPVEFSSEVTPQEQDLFWRACEDWGRFAEIDCYPKASAPTDTKSYIFVQKSDSGCFAHLGAGEGVAPPTSKRIINLASNCWTHGVIVHEIGHSLGWVHEHQRDDRDRYVEIAWSEIADGQGFNFSFLYSSRLITPYDFNSIMHYGPFSFSKGEKPTLIPRPRYVEEAKNMGQRQGPSDLDHELAVRVYGKKRWAADRVKAIHPAYDSSTQETAPPFGPLP